MEQAIQGLPGTITDDTITQTWIRDDSETICQLRNRLRGTFLQHARTNQTTDVALLMSICVLTDTATSLETDAFLNELARMVA